MSNFTTLKTFEMDAFLNKVALPVKVTIEVAEDDIVPAGDFDFGDAAENEAYLDQFKSGELFIAVIRVTAEALGEEGTDYLGGCHVHSNNAFNSDPFAKDIDQLVMDHGMVDKALGDLMQAILIKANRLKPYIK